MTAETVKTETQAAFATSYMLGAFEPSARVRVFFLGITLLNVLLDHEMFPVNMGTVHLGGATFPVALKIHNKLSEMHYKAVVLGCFPNVLEPHERQDGMSWDSISVI